MSEEFRKHIKKDGYDLDRIEEKLRFGKNDVLKTECPVVITGEEIFIQIFDIALNKN